ncbi:hypothetical protein ABEF95_001284 [Exophiala dermatitidis]
MAYLQPNTSNHPPPEGVPRRDYSTPLPFAYARESAKTRLSTQHPVHLEENLNHTLQPSGVRPGDVKLAPHEWPQLKEHSCRRERAPNPEIPVRTHRPTASATEKALRDNTLSAKTPTFNFSRPQLGKSGPAPSNPTETGLGRVFRDGVMHQMKRKGRVAYEHVDGVSMDTHPAASNSEYDSNEPIPEIEARDINQIEPETEHDYDTAYVEGQGDRTSSARSSQSSKSANDDVPSRQWSGTSQSTSATSISDTIAPQGSNGVINPSFTMSNQTYGDAVHLFTGAVLPADKVASPYAHLEDDGAASSTSGRKIELGVIKEEDTESIAGGIGLDVAPSPAVPGVKPEESSTHQTLEHLLPMGANAREEAGTTSPADSVEGGGGIRLRQPRVLAAPGIGHYPHVYELEAINATRTNSDPSSPSRNGTADHSVADSVSSQSSRDTGVAHSVQKGISKAAHAIEEKVKKSVTFSPVEDVRFLTPSPNRLGGGGRHKANKLQSGKAR